MCGSGVVGMHIGCWVEFVSGCGVGVACGCTAAECEGVDGVGIVWDRNGGGVQSVCICKGEIGETSGSRCSIEDGLR